MPDCLKNKANQKGWVDRNCIEWQKWCIYVFKVNTKNALPLPPSSFHFRVIVNKKKISSFQSVFQFIKIYKS